MSNYFKGGHCFETMWRPDPSAHDWRFRDETESLLDEIDAVLALVEEYQDKREWTGEAA